MPVPSFIVSCLDNRVIAKDVYEFRFSKPEGFTFKAGQFVLFDVALIDHPDDIQTRALSIASAPSENDLLFVVKTKEGGRASRWISEKLQPGDSVRMQGSFGRFLVPSDPDRNLLFIATSTGIAPFRSHIIDLIEKKDQRRMDIIFGVRSEEDLFWKEDIEKFAQQSENVFIHFALSNPSVEWKGHRGRVQTLVPLIDTDIAQRTVLVCGSPDMTKELKQLCLDTWKVPKEFLHVEGYI